MKPMLVLLALTVYPNGVPARGVTNAASSHRTGGLAASSTSIS